MTHAINKQEFSKMMDRFDKKYDDQKSNPSSKVSSIKEGAKKLKAGISQAFTNTVEGFSGITVEQAIASKAELEQKVDNLVIKLRDILATPLLSAEKSKTQKKVDEEDVRIEKEVETVDVPKFKVLKQVEDPTTLQKILNKAKAILIAEDKAIASISSKIFTILNCIPVIGPVLGTIFGFTFRSVATLAVATFDVIAAILATVVGGAGVGILAGATGAKKGLRFVASKIQMLPSIIKHTLLKDIYEELAATKQENKMLINALVSLTTKKEEEIRKMAEDLEKEKLDAVKLAAEMQEEIEKEEPIFVITKS